MTGLSARLLLVSLAVFSVTTFVSLPGNSLLMQEIQDTLHTVFFAIFACTGLWMLRRQSSTGTLTAGNYLLIVCVCALTGIAAETGQSLTGRGFSVLDVLRDTAGIALGSGICFLVMAERARHSRPARIALGLLLCLIAYISLYPLGSLAVNYAGRNAAFPVLLDLDARWSHSFSRLLASTRGTEPGACEPALTELRLTPVRYSGIILEEPRADWRAYSQLALQLQTASTEPVRVEVRVHDRQHNNEFDDRFNYSLTVEAGKYWYRVPLEAIRHGPGRRALDLGQVEELQIFSATRPHPDYLCVGRIQLE